ncbi:MAG: hypothetical protein IJV31_09225 [Clostridia bacterium]|nr:hypothetical protein [Clostridia bacterium]
MENVRRIFVNIALEGWVELNNNDFINNEKPFVWIQKNNIEDYSFICVHYQGIAHKVHVSQFQFMH